MLGSLMMLASGRVVPIYQRFFTSAFNQSVIFNTLEIAVISKSLRRLEQQAVIAMFPQQPFQPPQRARVIIHDKYGFSVRHDQ